MPELSLGYSGLAFLAGFLMFLAPCTLPLVPPFLAYISGNATQNYSVVKNAFSFCLGFSLVFISFGFLAGLLGALLMPAQVFLTTIAGIAIVVLGIQLLSPKPGFWFRSKVGFSLPSQFLPGSLSGTFSLGVIFALGWSPCIGPLLASILLLASSEGGVLSGGYLLFIFSIGMSVPFIIVALYLKQAQQFIQAHQTLARYSKLVSGLLLILIGTALLSGGQGLLFSVAEKVFYTLGLDFLLRFY